MITPTRDAHRLPNPHFHTRSVILHRPGSRRLSSTIYPRHSTLNNQHSTLNAQCSTLNTQPPSLNPKSETRNPKPQRQELELEAQELRVTLEDARAEVLYLFSFFITLNNVRALNMSPPRNRSTFLLSNCSLQGYLAHEQLPPLPRTSVGPHAQAYCSCA